MHTEQSLLPKALKAQETEWMHDLPCKKGVNADQEVEVLVKDFQRREGVTISLNDSKVTPEDTLIRGRFFNQELRKGLSLHCSNTKEEHAFTSHSTQLPGLSCIFFLRGEVDIKIGHQDFSLKPSRQRLISAAGLLKKHQEPFQRTTKQPQYVRHLVVSATPDWLAESGFNERIGSKLDKQLATHSMASNQWPPTPRLVESINEIFSPSLLMPELLDLHLEARAIDIVTETLASLLKTHHEEPAMLSRHEQLRLQRARELILANPSQVLSVEYIAREAGISSSGLQRLFRRKEGCSVFDYVRRVRLEQALSLLRAGSTSVQEVSAIAGYKNPANFATAFKRRFGMTPRQASGC